MSTTPIEIALASDQKYFPGLLVTAFSMCKYADKNAVLSFNILDGGFCDDSFSILKRAVGIVHPNVVFKRFKIDEHVFSLFPDWRGNKMTYVRFLLPSLLPDSQFVIYADADCLWFADVMEVWKRREQDVAVQGVLDPYGAADEVGWFARRKISFAENKYFCSGLILMNLRLFREKHIIEQATDFLIEHPDVQYPDQTALNYVLRDSVKLLPDKFNRFTLGIGSKDIYAPVVLHFANDFPWTFCERNPGVPPPYMMWWYSCYAEATRTPIRQVLRQFNASRMLPSFRIGKLLSNRLFRHFVFGLLFLLGKKHYLPSLRRYSVKYAKLIQPKIMTLR